ncbi:MAG TPA: ABC-type transport auxiliary lipoprotein family protein [Candidatus Acidoferrales bacterium]|nr:ABC-type transport auxiliary lipoprotein family protein [Candidatus Acidoferrales bacterium]
MNRKLAWIAALLAGLLAGCGAARPSKYYELTLPADPPSASSSSPHDVAILIGPLRASHLYREDQIVYSSRTEGMGTYEYQRWAEPPTEMMAELLLRELRVSGRYRMVDALRSNSHGDYILYGRLYDFKEMSGEPLSTRLAMELQLREVKSGSTVWTHHYSHDEPVNGKDISAVVAALNRNAQRAGEEIQTSLDQFFSTAHPMR